MKSEDIFSAAVNSDRRALARAISLIENEAAGYDEMLAQLPRANVPVTGITGAPGAGKSSLTDRLIECFVADGKKVAVLCIDPSSPFTRGAILGDRIRMNRWFNNPDVYIRSLSGKGSMGGLSPKAIEITDLLRSTGFDHVILETIGVGQNEIDVSRFADTTVVVLVPEGGDEVQTMKAGLMEVADIFVVNKADRPGAASFVKDLNQMTAGAFGKTDRLLPIFKTVATENEGIKELYTAILKNSAEKPAGRSAARLYAEKAFELIAAEKMKGFQVEELQTEIEEEMRAETFNLYTYLKKYKH